MEKKTANGENLYKQINKLENKNKEYSKNTKW